MIERYEGSELKSEQEVADKKSIEKDKQTALDIRKTPMERYVITKRMDRSSSPEVFLGKRVLKICSKFTGEHPCRSVILIKLQSNFIEITLRHGCPPVNLLHIFRTPFPENTLEGCLCREMEGDDQPKEKESRRTSADMFTFLQEKLEFDKERLRQEQERRVRGKIMH